MLLGNLHLRLKQYGLAVKAFDQVVKDYEPGVELRRIIRERGDPTLPEIIATGLDKLSAELAAAGGARWAREAETRRGVRLFANLQRGERDSRKRTSDREDPQPHRG